MNKKLILIVDDDIDDIELFKEVIDELDPDLECISARNGKEAFRLLEQTNPLPDFIFLDLNMPRMNGKACLAELKKNLFFQSIPVIIYTTSRLAADVEETRRLGAAYFMTKPTRFVDLQEALSMILLSKPSDDGSLEAILTAL